jgi:hypothetical protein
MKSVVLFEVLLYSINTVYKGAHGKGCRVAGNPPEAILGQELHCKYTSYTHKIGLWLRS